LEERSSPATFALSELLPGQQYKLATARRLDYEVETGSSAVVVCRDRGRPALTTRVNISVAIVDRNDNAPRFQQSRYELHVAENKPADFVVEQVLDDHYGLYRRHRIDKYLPNKQLGRRCHQPIDKRGHRKMADCPSYYYSYY